MTDKTNMRKPKPDLSATEANLKADVSDDAKLQDHRDAELEKELDDSFPASDAPTTTRRSKSD